MRPVAAGILLSTLVILTHGCGSEKSSRSPGAATTATVAPDEAKDMRHAAHVDNRPVIVALGDSLTAGYGLRESESYPSRLQELLDARGYRYRVVNAGVSGDTTAQGLNRIQLVIDYRPVVVIIELGPNDGLRGMPIQSTRANLEEIIQRCQQAGAKVVLAGMTLPPNYTRGYIQSFESIYKELAGKYRTALIPFFLEGVAGLPDLNLEDNIHPNAAGCEIVAANALRILQPMLKK